METEHSSRQVDTGPGIQQRRIWGTRSSIGIYKRRSQPPEGSRGPGQKQRKGRSPQGARTQRELEDPGQQGAVREDGKAGGEGDVLPPRGQGLSLPLVYFQSLTRYYTQLLK